MPACSTFSYHLLSCFLLLAGGGPLSWRRESVSAYFEFATPATWCWGEGKEGAGEGRTALGCRSGVGDLAYCLAFPFSYPSSSFKKKIEIIQMEKAPQAHILPDSFSDIVLYDTRVLPICFFTPTLLSPDSSSSRIQLVLKHLITDRITSV